jgi:hypothetical protein
MAKKRLWLVRRVAVGGGDRTLLLECEGEPEIGRGGLVDLEFCRDIVIDATSKDFRRRTGISVPKGHVVEVESIQITLAGKARKAKVAT